MPRPGSRLAYSTSATDRGPCPTYFARRANQLRLALLLEDVCRPSGDARAGEHRREQVRRHFGQIKHDRRPELDVRREHAVGLTGVELRERSLLERFGDFKARRAKFCACAPQHPRAGVFGAVDAMAEAHQPLTAVERLADPPLGVARLFDFIEHLQHARGRPAVQRAR